MLPRILLVVAGVLAGCGLVAAGAMTGVQAPAADGPSPVVRVGDPSAATVASAPPVSDPAPEATTAPPSTSPPSTAAPAPPPRPRAVAAPAGNAGARPAPRRPPPRPNRTSEAPTQAEPSAAPVTPAPGPAAPPSTARYPQDFPDPFVFRAGSFWYAMSTQRGLAKVPVIRSVDLVHWEDRGDALPALPKWSRFGAVWAPSVLAVGAAGFVLYYATPDEATGLQCISYAVSALPDGPYVDPSSGPLVCQTDRGGSIDPSPFRDADGRPWLVWKSEGTVDGEPTRIWSQPLSEDGRGLFGGPTELLSTAQPWEQPIIEAPSMARLGDGSFHLFYSGNRWETSAYGIGHARCDGPAGPCRRTAPSPVLVSHPSEAGGGSGEIFVAPDGSPKLAYHAWDPSAIGYPGGLRRLRIGSIRLTSDGSAVVEPTVP